MFISDHDYYIAEWISFSLSIFSLCCTVATLMIIQRMKKRSGYVHLISIMTFFQLLYDINFILRPVPSYATCLIWNFLDVLGGLGNAFFSNVISWTIIYVVYKVKSYNIIANLPYFWFFCGFVPFVIALLTFFALQEQNFDDDDSPFQYCIYGQTQLSSTVQNFYYWGRLFAIVFNFGSFIYVSFRIRKIAALATQSKRGSMMDKYHMTTRQTAATATVHEYITEQQVDAIFVLASRMIYYPIAQSFGRAGSAWNELLDHRFESRASLFTSAITAPLSGCLYFLIFLIMQPHARTILYNFLKGKPAGHALSLSAMQRHNIQSILNDPEYGGQKRFVFRDSLSQADEGDLEDIINDKQLNAIPLQWTNNPVQHENRLQSTTGSIAWFQDRLTAEQRDTDHRDTEHRDTEEHTTDHDLDRESRSIVTRETHGSSIVSSDYSKSFVSRSTESRSMLSMDSRSTLSALSDLKAVMIEMKPRNTVAPPTITLSTNTTPFTTATTTITTNTTDTSIAPAQQPSKQ